MRALVQSFANFWHLKMGKAAGNQVSFSSSFIHIELLLSCFLICCFLSIAFSSFLVTFPALVLSILFLFIFSHRKATNAEAADKDVAKTLHATQTTKETQKAETGHVQSRPVEILKYPLEEEGINCYDSITNENLELCSEHLSNVETSEGSVCNEEDSQSDDDSLIEIALPGNNSFTYETMSKQVDNVQESVFSQELMEILAVCNEIIEEENLIEIDISIGSIKCPNLEIEA